MEAVVDGSVVNRFVAVIEWYHERLDLEDYDSVVVVLQLFVE
jgi:hypothetical protein